MDGDGRTEPGPACSRGPAVTLRFDGRAVRAYEGESVGAALHAGGHHVLMRSVKYHRPRALFCMTGACANCLVRVDGVPNVRACVTPVRDGMRVETQNSWPSARRDFFAIVDKVYRENFDYHRKFIRPAVLTPVYHRVIRAMAGFGKIPDLKPIVRERPPIRQREVDVLVVGAGASGLAAAVAAAEGAANVLVVDEAPRAGGSLLLHRDALGRDGVDVASDLARRVSDAGGEVLTRTVAFGAYLTDGRGNALRAPGVVPLLTPDGIVETRPRALVVAAGHHETPPLFPGNDLPGVMGVRAGLILLHAHGVLPGARVALAGEGDLLARAAADLARADVDVVWEKDARVVEAFGGTRVEGVVLERDGATWKEPVDAVLAAGDETPRVELLQQCGVPMTWRESYVPVVDQGRTPVAGVFAAGSVAGRRALASRLEEGAHVGEAAARHARQEAVDARAAKEATP